MAQLCSSLHTMGAGMAQWWEHLSPTDVARDRFSTRRNMWVELAVGSLLCSERFSSGYPGFPLSSKTNIFNFWFDPGFSGLIATMTRCHCKFPLLLFYSSRDWENLQNNFFKQFFRFGLLRCEKWASWGSIDFSVEYSVTLYKMNCRSFNERNNYVAFFPKDTANHKITLNGARDETTQCVIMERRLRESNRCQKMIKGKPR